LSLPASTHNRRFTTSAFDGVGFAIICSLARDRRPQIQFLSIARVLLRASFRLRLAAHTLRFAITSPPSGCAEDFHLKAIEHVSTHENGTDIAVCPENSVELTLGGDGLLSEQMRGDFAEVQTIPSQDMIFRVCK